MTVAFADPFLPAGPLYSGAAVSGEVGGGTGSSGGGSSSSGGIGRYHCAINGRGYLIDRKSGEHRWAFEPRVRDSVDQSALPGEAAISSQGMWRRAQSTWNLGAGQQFADDDEAIPGRFEVSKGIDVWTKGEMSLLNDTAQVVAATGTNLVGVSVGSRFYICDGQTVKYTSSVTSPSFTTVTGTAAANVTDMTTDGTAIFIGQGASGIYRSAVSGSTASSHITGTVDKVEYVKGRLMVSGGTSIYNPIAAGALPTALFTHPNTGWTWVGFAAGQQHIYAAGYAGATSLVYRINITDDATSLGQPVVAAELPRGETVRSIGSYLGFILLGTSKGARFCQADGDGNLVIGALVATPNPVLCFTASDRFVWFGWTGYDSTSTGLGRMDLSQFTAASTPAYASDLMVTSQAAITSVEMHGNEPVFAVSGVGFYTSSANLVASGTLETGVFSYGVPDVKVLSLFDFVTRPMEGSVAAFSSSDRGLWIGLGTMTSGARFTFVAPQDQTYSVGFRLLLTRKASDATKGPVVERWSARAFVSPSRSQVIVAPLVLHTVMEMADGSQEIVDVADELAQLRDLIATPRTVLYQEAGASVSVLVEDVTWVPMSVSGSGWAGTALVTMRTVEA